MRNKFISIDSLAMTIIEIKRNLFGINYTTYEEFLNQK